MCRVQFNEGVRVKPRYTNSSAKGNFCRSSLSEHQTVKVWGFLGRRRPKRSPSPLLPQSVSKPSPEKMLPRAPPLSNLRGLRNPDSGLTKLRLFSTKKAQWPVASFYGKGRSNTDSNYVVSLTSLVTVSAKVISPKRYFCFPAETNGHFFGGTRAGAAVAYCPGP